MLPHVRAKTNRRPIENHLPHQTTSDQDAQAIIDRRERNFRIRPLGALENLLRSGMVMTFGDHIEHLLALPRHAQPARGEALGKLFVFVQMHARGLVFQRIRCATEGCQIAGGELASSRADRPVSWRDSRSARNSFASTRPRRFALVAASMNEADSIYPAGAFEGEDDSAAVVGQITVSTFALRFESEAFTLDLPTRGLQMWLDETGDRIFFSHDNFPGWTVYSLDPAILQHHSLNQPFLKKRVQELTHERSQSPRHAARVYGAFGVIAAILIALWAVTDPIIGVIVNMLPEEWETQVGKEAFAEVREIFPLTEEPALTNRVHLVTQRLKKGLAYDAPKFRFHVSDVPLVNAIAVPGGDVVVMQGLLEEAAPDELAAVLAHEMAHVIEKHAMRQIAQDAGPSFISKYIFGGDSALSALLDGTSAIGQLQYSRQNEKSADKTAFSILLNANIDPRSLSRFFEKLNKIEKEFGGADIFSTHPPTEERIKYLQTLWDESPKKSGFEAVHAGPDIPRTEKRRPFLF